MGLLSALYKEHPMIHASFGLTKVTLPHKQAKYFPKYFVPARRNLHRSGCKDRGW
jgi:hypothetical protein